MKKMALKIVRLNLDTYKIKTIFTQFIYRLTFAIKLIKVLKIIIKKDNKLHKAKKNNKENWSNEQEYW